VGLVPIPTSASIYPLGTQKVLEDAIEEAHRMGHHYISTEHLLLAIVLSTEDKAGTCCENGRHCPEQIRRQTENECWRRHQPADRYQCCRTGYSPAR